MSDMNQQSGDEWWQCPKCEADTEVNRQPAEDEPDRECTECDWSVRIQRQEEE